MSPDGSTKSPLPEEKLLKLIRGKGAKPDAADAPTSTAGGGDVASAVARAVLSGRAKSVSWSRMVVTCLAVVLTIELVLLVLQVVRPTPTVKIPVVPTPPSTPNGSPPGAQLDIPSLAESAGPALFTPSATGPASTSTGTTVRVAPSVGATALASRLTLLGIVAGEPSQAIIEDAQTKKTYFVSPGQPIVEGAVLDQVLDNHVILDLQGEKIELTL